MLFNKSGYDGPLLTFVQWTKYNGMAFSNYSPMVNWKDSFIIICVGYLTTP